MPIINFTNPVTILIGVLLFVLVLYLGKEVKKAWIVGLLLFGFVGVLLGHAIEFATIAKESATIYKSVTTSATFDLVFIFITFMSYLWVDDIEAKAGKKKSIDNSLDWFWNKV